MTAVTIAEASRSHTARPRPTPGPGRDTAPAYRVAPPVEDGFAPWVAVLEQPPAPGDLRWTVGPEGVLLPARESDDAAGARSRERALRCRLAALIRR